MIIYYEDLEKDFKGNIIKILNYLDIKIPEKLTIKTDFLKQSDEVNKQIIKEYKKILF